MCLHFTMSENFTMLYNVGTCITVFFITGQPMDLHHSCPEVVVGEVESQSSVPSQATVTVDVSNACNQDAAVSEEIKDQQKPSVNRTHVRINRAAKQAMFKLRQLHVEKQGDPNVIIIDDNNAEQSRQKVSPKSKKHDTQQEISNILLSVTAWLTCTVIDAAQQLLKALPCNNFSGFQSVAVGLTMQFEIQETEFVQIVHCNSGHWLTVSTIGCEPSEVRIYDSLYSSASECVQCQIATLLATPSSHITLHFMDVQMQAGTYDCGLFAVAFATALVHGFNPGQYFFDQSSMRRHLWKCLRNQKMLMFPFTKERRSKNKVKTTQEIAVHCLCRLPSIGMELIECTVCKVWYHANICVPVEKCYFSRGVNWSCPQCLSTTS